LKRIFNCLLLIIVFLNFTLQPGFTQTSIPKPAEIDQIDQKFIKPSRHKIPKPVIIPKEKNIQPPSEAPLIHFVLKDIIIKGSTVYFEFSTYYQTYLNKKISLADAYIIAQTITQRYRNDGYILSRVIVPAQEISNGILTLQIIEGFIEDVVIEDQTLDKRILLRVYADKILTSKPLHISVLERYLLLMNDLPGIQVKSILTASKNTFGASTLTLITDHKIINGHIGIDNLGSRFNGPYQTSLSLQFNSLFRLYERMGIRMVASSEMEELRYLYAFHEQQIGHEGTKLFSSGSLSSTKPGHTLKNLDVEGESYTASFLLRHPFIRSRGRNCTINTGFSYRNSQTDILGEKIPKTACVLLLSDFLMILRIVFEELILSKQNSVKGLKYWMRQTLIPTPYPGKEGEVILQKFPEAFFAYNKSFLVGCC